MRYIGLAWQRLRALGAELDMAWTAFGRPWDRIGHGSDRVWTPSGTELDRYWTASGRPWEQLRREWTALGRTLDRIVQGVDYEQKRQIAHEESLAQSI